MKNAHEIFELGRKIVLSCARWALVVLGWFLAVLTVLLFLTSITGSVKNTATGKSDYSMVIIAPIIFGLPAFSMLIGARIIKKQRQNYSRYGSEVNRRGVYSLVQLAANLGVPYDIAVAELRQLIRWGYFAGAFINDTRGELVWPALPGGTQAAMQAQPPVKGTQNIKCYGCGAVNAVPLGQTVECEYCGSPLYATDNRPVR